MPAPIHVVVYAGTRGLPLTFYQRLMDFLPLDAVICIPGDGDHLAVKEVAAGRGMRVYPLDLVLGPEDHCAARSLNGADERFIAPMSPTECRAAVRARVAFDMVAHAIAVTPEGGTLPESPSAAYHASPPREGQVCFGEPAGEHVLTGTAPTVPVENARRASRVLLVTTLSARDYLGCVPHTPLWVNIDPFATTGFATPAFLDLADEPTRAAARALYHSVCVLHSRLAAAAARGVPLAGIPPPSDSQCTELIDLWDRFPLVDRRFPPVLPGPDETPWARPALLKGLFEGLCRQDPTPDGSAQGSDLWLGLRERYFTATAPGQCLLYYDGTPARVYYAMIDSSLATPTEVTEAMQYGSANEDVAVALFREVFPGAKTGFFTFTYSTTHTDLGCSLDGLVFGDTNGRARDTKYPASVLEVKCKWAGGSLMYRYDPERGIDETYLAQTTMQMAMMGLERTYLIVMSKERLDVFSIPFLPELWAMLRDDLILPLLARVAAGRAAFDEYENACADLADCVGDAEAGWAADVRISQAFAAVHANAPPDYGTPPATGDPLADPYMAKVVAIRKMLAENVKGATCPRVAYYDRQSGRACYDPKQGYTARSFAST
jgi:hypothetical protein